MKRGFRLSAPAFCLFAALLSASAQERARKIDEFGHAHGCDHGARLDNFAIELQNHPDAAGYVIAYGPRGEGSGTGDFRLRVTEDYLVNVRGLDAGRIETVNGGRYKTRDEAFVELWLVPPGAEPPRPSEYRNDADKFKGKFAEYETWDSFAWGEATGPPVGNSKLAGFADVLKSQAGARAYIVAFNSEASAPGAWRRVAEQEVDALKRHGVADGRVRVIFGGYGDKLKIQLWALPGGAPPPVKDAGPERKMAKAAQVGSMDGFQLKYDDEARSFFRGFAEVLKADASLSVYLVIRLSTPQEADLDSPPRDPPEPPDVDLAQLAEKWRGELLKEYGISDQRFVVTVVPPQDEWSGGMIEAWVVPWGAAPPDPYASEDGDAEETEEVNSKES